MRLNAALDYLEQISAGKIDEDRQASLARELKAAWRRANSKAVNIHQTFEIGNDRYRMEIRRKLKPHRQGASQMTIRFNKIEVESDHAVRLHNPEADPSQAVERLEEQPLHTF